MKKTIVFVSFLLMGMNVWAQDTTAAAVKAEEPVLKSKKGDPILPVAGDWSVSASTANLFGYLGGLFNNNNNYNPAYIFNGTTISVGYFKTNRLVYNMSVSIYSQADAKSNYVTDDSNTSPIYYSQVKDTKVSTQNRVYLGFGLEKRYGGQKRFQRFLGAGINLGYAGDYQKAEYANQFSFFNQTPSSTLFFQPFNGSGKVDNRILEQNNGTTVSVGLSANAGLEYFFLPKMSLGLTFSAGPRFSQTFGGYGILESYSTITQTGIESKYKMGNTSSLNFTTYTGSIYFRLFF